MAGVTIQLLVGEGQLVAFRTRNFTVHGFVKRD
jgi:hypothetical protein